MSNVEAETTPVGVPFSPAQQVEQMLRREAALLPQNAALRPLHKEIQRCCARLRLPVRVAIVGLIKAGKSTLMNAMLGQILVPTGSVEATFNVNWFHYGETPELRVHFRDGRPPETRPFAALEEITRRAEETMETLLEIAYVEVCYPAEVLRTLHLVDTPGLASSYESDSDNTKRFLQLHGAQLTATTQEEAASADATLYLFSQGVSETDMGVVEEFLGGMGARMTPLNALGVLTRADVYWTAPDPTLPEPPAVDPLEMARTITQRLMQTPRLRNAFYALYPVCGLIGEGAATLTDAEFETLVRLSRLPWARLAGLLSSAQRFRTREDADIPATPAERRALLLRLGQYGIWLACERLREEECDKAAILSCLLSHSGVPEIRERILSHFGNRAALVKTAAALTALRNCWTDLRKYLSGKDLQAGLQFLGALEKLELEEHAFQELRVLRDYYEGRLKLSAEETRQLLTVTGERGPEPWARLGTASETSPAELKSLADTHIRFWAYRATDMLNRDGAARYAATVIQRSYERVRHQVAQAETAAAETP